MRKHTADDSPEDLSGSTVVEGTVTGVGVGTLAQEGQVLKLVTVEGSADVDTLATHSNDLLASQQLLGDSRRQTAQQMSSAINNHLLLEHSDESLVRFPTLSLQHHNTNTTKTTSQSVLSSSHLLFFKSLIFLIFSYSNTNNYAILHLRNAPKYQASPFPTRRPSSRIFRLLLSSFTSFLLISNSNHSSLQYIEAFNHHRTHHWPASSSSLRPSSSSRF